MMISSNWIIVACMSLAVLREVITMYVCEMIIVLYSVYWLILCLLWSVWCFFHLNYRHWYVIGCSTRSDYFGWLWNDYYLISSSLIGSLLPKICMLFLFIWIIVACMLLAIWQKVLTLYDCKIIIILYPIHWLIVYLLRSVCCLFSF